MSRPTAPGRPRRRALLSGLAALTTVAATALASTATAGAAPATPALPAAAHAAVPAAPSAGARTVTYDGYSFLVEGQRTYLWSGEVHYFRLPSPSLWLDIFQKMKAAGFNATSLYVDWGYHSAKQGQYDFTGIRDVDAVLDAAQQAGLYVIARPAPYINAEVDGGGYPGWMSTTPGQNRSPDPTYLAYADEWQSQIDAILARRQLTNGGGPVIAYQVENEYYNGSAAGRAYLQHMEDKARADGITVPLTGNNNGTFNSGAGALDVDGPDSYPQGFDCSNPTRWNGVPDISYDHPAGKPLYTPEFQGGAFDPWGGPGYDKCAQLIDDQFANVFYKNNIAVGATAQSFYMLFGGTNWGWLGMPENYTSYDYGAAIRETRQLDPKYDEDKLIGYLTQSVAPLTKTDPLAVTAPDDTAVVDTARINPDTRTQFHVLRHADSTSTAVDRTHVSLDLAATGSTSYSYDDADTTHLQYTGSAWQHVADQSYTGGDYQRTESFSDHAGDSVSVPFSGTAIRWIAPTAANHGLADVYLDGVKQTTVDGYSPGTDFQKVLFQKSGLSDGPHTLKIVVDGTHSDGSGGSYVSVDAVDLSVPPPALVVPQQPGTAITLNGRDSHILVANDAFGAQQLRYSTSEIMTTATIGDRDVALLYGDQGTDGETVLHYASQPTVTVQANGTAGSVTSTWDAATGDLRLNYRHGGLARVTVSGGGAARPVLLLLADKPTAETFWRQDTAAGPVLVRGTHLLRTATTLGTTLALTGDNGDDNGIEVFASAASGSSVTWNGARVQTRATTSGSRVGVISVRQPVTLPALTDWKHAEESPESAPGFDDSRWVTADKTTSNSVDGDPTTPVLYADDYGFHTGNVWYRGRFTGSAGATGITLTSPSGGAAQSFSVWLNGTFLGSSRTGAGTFSFPAGTQKVGADNVLSVLTIDMGHEEDYNSTNGNKSARGLTSAALVGSPLSSITWRLQGDQGGEDVPDPVRGPLSTGGLYGERAGWHLPGFPDAGWASTTLPTSDTRAGVSWYRTTTTLALPKGQDTSVGLTIADDPSRHYRAELFVNGWMVGNYVNDLGPQHSFPVPNGILDTRGRNTIAIAVWNLDGSTGGLGAVSLTSYGTWTSPLQVSMNDSPGYDRARYAQPSAPKASVALAVPDGVTAGSTFTAKATVSVPTGAPAATSLTPRLVVPAGWSASAPSPVVVGRVAPGGSATVSWTVTAPATLPSSSALSVTVGYQQGRTGGILRDERIVRALPAPPAAGQDAVSSLPFLSTTNGWGPVERDTSNGEKAAGDGHPLTVAGAVYAKGLGTNAVSDVTLYTAGRCTRFTGSVGVDDETGGAGTVTFSVLADGKAVYTSPVLRGHQAAVPVDVDVSGAQSVDLVVGDGGDGNGNDHGDWLTPVLTCG
ncbi:beta-galactosidase [Lapillicoccus jejuensis]|uniref:Beta-galactosidase n=1 Tax=Lapillicoccus jejuensis TaxID=402171 RepID=A0A542E0Z7_9MICO|nr:beta-galactosidase [Lapillicoccus jejuensis]TQJ09013.1 alpha-galactosidase-like protein [Lapillicoccus jejuensis]